jgi:hypothetical protein
MKLAELEARLVALEKAVAELKEQAAKNANPTGPWWKTEAGRFANDPVFDEIVRLGREYRESLHPDRRKKKKKPQPKSKKNARS